MGGIRDFLWKVRWLFFALFATSFALSIALTLKRRGPGEGTDMGAGTLAVACLWLTGQVPGDMVYTNQLRQRIDVRFKSQRSEIKELRLFASPDQGRSWDLAATITPDKDFFEFRARGDGTYWLRVASVDHANRQTPENPASGPPDQRMVVDTVKPVIRMLNARRQGSDVIVAWEVQEDHPDVASFRLEYQPKDGGGLWTAISATPAPKGETHFQPSGTQPLHIRLTMRDLAGNASYHLVEVGGDGVTTALYDPAQHPGAAIQISGTLPTGGGIDLHQEMKVPTPMTPSPAATLPGPIEPQAAPMNPSNSTPPSMGQGAPPAPDPKVIASSAWAPTPSPAQTQTPIAPPSGVESRPTTTSIATRKLPPLQHINQPEFLVEYEVSKHGPSGIGSVELWRTTDDGQTWEKYAYDAIPPALGKGRRQQRTVQFHEGEPDGIYGFRLVIKNRANIGRRPPQPGEAPEIRIKLDTKLPTADLLSPVRDTQPGCLLLSWRAGDENIAPAPVNLEWAEQLGGKWNPIGLNLANTGRYSWKVPEEMPVNVYLRLRVRDLAGNETTVTTPSPLPVDLFEPEGHLVNVSVPAQAR